jgi:hypothetical protein
MRSFPGFRTTDGGNTAAIQFSSKNILLKGAFMHSTTRTVTGTISTSNSPLRQEGKIYRAKVGTFVSSLIGIGVLGCAAQCAYGGQVGPPDNGNSADGDGALWVIGNRQGNGTENSAYGYAALYFTETGTGNTAVGYNSMAGNNGGGYNTAIGDSSLSQTTGSENTAVGYWALMYATGDQNTGVGYQALVNSAANSNTALGWQSLSADTTGADNTAAGSSTLAFNTTGGNNAAFGYGALYHNNASDNTAVGWQSLNANSSGSDNTVSGAQAMLFNTTGYQNSAVGFDALLDNSTGNSNAAVGTSALSGNTTGSDNIAMGYQAGFRLTTGSNNIDFGNVGVAGESGTIRLGTPGTHAAAYIAGISTSHLTGAAVYVNSSGQLGVLASSERYKTAISPMAAAPDKVQQLRPVTFHLKSEPRGALQYGLIAEEVERVYPDLVIRDERGVVQGVRYDELTSILLKEVQQQHKELERQRDIFGEQIAILKKQAAENPRHAPQEVKGQGPTGVGGLPAN